jgi:lipooligosaccharide transport system permease protein
VAKPRRAGSAPDRVPAQLAHRRAAAPAGTDHSAAGVRGGLGGFIPEFAWRGRPVSYLAYLAPGMLAYTAFMTAFFQALFAAYIRMHYQKTWEGQLITQVRLEHVVWGEVLWAATLGTVYALIVILVLAGFALAGWLASALGSVLLILPLLFLAALAFATLGLLFTALVPSIDHMNIPFFLVIMPLGFASSTYFPMEGDSLWTQAWLTESPCITWRKGFVSCCWPAN